jgi:hypothetical protein
MSEMQADRNSLMSYVTTSERQLLLTAEITAVKTRPAFAQVLNRVSDAFGFKYITLMDAPSAESFMLKPLLIETSLPHPTSTSSIAPLHAAAAFSKAMSDSVVPSLWNLSRRSLRLSRRTADIEARLRHADRHCHSGARADGIGCCSGSPASARRLDKRRSTN